MMVKRKETASNNPRPGRGGAASRFRLALICTGLLVSMNICLFGAFEIISSNRSEFNVTAGEVLPLLLAFSLALAAVIFLLGVLLPRRARRGSIAVLLAVGVLLWVQGSFLRWDYGVLDGTAIDWGSFLWQGWLDALIWLVVLSAAVRSRDRLGRQAIFGALAIIIVQAAVLIPRAVSLSSRPGISDAGQQSAGEMNQVPPEICQLSSSRNIFHIILDSFQTDVFLELVREEGLAGSLDGFVVFPENISTGGRTILSIPAVFSSVVYDGDETESEYFSGAMQASFNRLLYKHGYVVNLLPHVSMKNNVYTHYFMIRATYAESRWAGVMRASSYLVDLSMFRQFPHFLKRIIYNGQNWRLSSLVSAPPNHISFHHKAFFQDYTRKLEVAYPQPAYHFLHMMPPHPPFVTLADGSYAGRALPHSRDNYKNEARYMVRLFMDFLEKLQSLGIYDSSVVLLHGDTGAGWRRAGDESAAGMRAGRVSALLLFKPADLHGPLKVSPAQASLTDIPATLMGYLGIEHTYSGESLFELEPASTRSRRVVFVPDQSAREPTVLRWEVRGTVFDSTSWHQLEPRRVEQRIRPYRWGTPVAFGIANEGGKYLTSGWSTTAAAYTWNNGKTAEITVGIEAPDRDVQVQLVFYPYLVPGKVDRQRIRISVNGGPPDELVCADPEGQVISKVILRELLQEGRMSLSFQFPDAVCPKDIGEGSESRVLAMKLLRFQADLVGDGR